jgi:Putative Ig domain
MPTVSTGAFQSLGLHIAVARSLRTSNHAARFFLFLFSALLVTSCGLPQNQRLPTPTLGTRLSALDGGDDAVGQQTERRDIVRRTRRITTSRALPQATVGTAYNAVISLSGGISPYYLSIVKGAIPAGLTLNSSTDTISGKPQVAGSYEFAVRATDLTHADFGIQLLTLVVAGAPAGSNISVQISPANPTVSSGGTQQFTATVHETLASPAGRPPSNVGVTWSATAGTISKTGLFVAPAVKVAATATVTATSVANPSRKASATVLVTASAPTPAPGPIITSTSVPPATAGAAYSAALRATGGQLPYTWRIASGALPQGLQLASASGYISGASSQSGLFYFTVQVTDGSGQTAQQSIPLTVAASNSCGPPTYPCSRSDVAVIVPNSPPPLGADPNYYGGHSGADRVAIDPAYNNRILRVTDGNITTAGMSFNTPSSAEKNVTSYDESLFLIHNEGNGLCLFQFDPSAFTSTFHGCFLGVGGGGSADFGYTEADNNAFYNYNQRKLYRFLIDRTTWTVHADPTFNNGQGYFDPDDPKCLNGQMAANHWYVHGHALSSDDKTVIAAVGPQQDLDPYFVVWNAEKGCQWLNVKTWQVSQGWNTGLANPVSISWVSGTAPTTAGGIHNAQIDRGGAYGVLTVQHAFGHKLFWTLGTNIVNDTCTKCTSHWACDYGVCLWDYHQGTGYTGYDMRSVPIGGSTTSASVDMSTMLVTPDMDTTPVLGQWGNDEHVSHANASPDAKNIYLVAWQPGTGSSTVSQLWADEITGINWDGTQRTIRFNKNWNSGYGGFWTSSRCPISRQGNYAICGSDYQMANLDKGFGNGLNQDTCDHTLPAGKKGTNGCRTDVLLFELK